MLLKQTPKRSHSTIQFVTKWFSNEEQGFLCWALCCELNRKDSCSLQIRLVNKTGCCKGYLPHTKQGKILKSLEDWERDLPPATKITCSLHFGGGEKSNITTDFLLLLNAGNKTRGSLIPKTMTWPQLPHVYLALQEMQHRNRCCENHALRQSRQNK